MPQSTTSIETSATQMLLPNSRVWAMAMLGIAAVAGLGGAYVKGRSDGKAVILASQVKEDQIRMETLQLAQQAAAEEISRIQVVNKTIYARATREVIEKPVYRECLHSPDGLRAVNEALTGNIPADPGELPATDPISR